jgi:hypothetical protein
MATNPLISLQARAPDTATTFSNALTSIRQGDQNRREAELQPFRSQILEAQAGQSSDQAKISSIATGAAQLLPFLNSGDVEGARTLLNNRIDTLRASNIDTSDSEEALTLLDQNPDLLKQRTGQAVQVGQQLGVIKSPRTQAVSAEQSAFENLIKDLPEEQKTEATLIKLGINPRAVSSADITIAESPELTEQIADSKAIIGQRKKFGELTGSSRAQAIDKGFERIVKIDTAVRNIDKAIGVLNTGAGVGAVERFIPSFRAASVELDNIQKSMALDVVGAVTFGALSKGELDLAKEVALPTGLDTPQLIEHLQKRKIAQQKLRGYFNDQIQFLDQGGTIAGFLREKERTAEAAPVQQAAPAATAPAPAQQSTDFDFSRFTDEQIKAALGQ